MVSSLRTPHGSSKTRSSHVRIHECSGDCALVRSSRSSSLAMKLRAESDASSVSSFVRYSPTTSSSPSPSSLRMAASCWRSRNSRCCLSTPSDTSLRMVSATCSSARCSRAQADTSCTRSATSTAASTSRLRSSARSAHDTTPSASAPGSRPERSSSGRRRERRSSAICSSTPRSSRASASTRGVGRGSRSTSASAYVAPRSEAWTAVTLARDSTRTMATGSPVGRAPTSGTWATTASWSSPARSRTRPSPAARAALDGAAHLVGDETERDHGPRHDGGRQLRQRQSSGGRGRGVTHASKDIDASPRLDTGALSFVGLWQTPLRRPSSRRWSSSFRYGITRRGQLTPSTPHSRPRRP